MQSSNAYITPQNLASLALMNAAHHPPALLVSAPARHRAQNRGSLTTAMTTPESLRIRGAQTWVNESASMMIHGNMQGGRSLLPVPGTCLHI